MISSIISRIVILVFGTLYPAYASYKAVKTKNVKEYVKWMMYWIVFALFTCTETFTDIFLSWFPFYYEIKIILVIWLLSPATKGSSILYRKFVHPTLSSREQEIDEYISKAKEQSYRQVLDLGQKGVSVLMQTAIKGGGGIVNQLKKSYSLSDLSDPTADNDEIDDVIVTDPRLVRRRKAGRSPHRSSSASSATVYFSEVDVVASVMVGGDKIGEVRSHEDISSGYSSGEGLYAANQPLKLQARESIQRTSSLTRARSTRVTRSSVPKKSTVASDDSDDNEVFDTNIIFLNDNVKNFDNLEEKHESSSSETEFFDIADSDFPLHGKITQEQSKSCQSINVSTKSSVVTACKNDSSLKSKLTKLSDALSSFSPISTITSPKSIKTTISIKENTSTQVNKSVEANKSFDKRTSAEPVKEVISMLLPINQTKTIEGANLQSNYQKPDIPEKIQNLEASISKVQTCSDDRGPENYLAETRGGKYNKKLAPLPPHLKQLNPTASPIKATLVLRPGVIRNLSKSSESINNKDIFLSSPKPKRRFKRSPSPCSASSKSSDSSASSKLDALSKMLRLPKKMTHLNIPSGKCNQKRNSWGDFFHAKKLVDSKMQSKSSSNLEKNLENENNFAMGEMKRSGSQISVRSLSDSPLAHRRLKILRRYVDNDID